MRPVYREIVIDMNTGRLISCVAEVDYSGPWAECRGETKTDEQAKKQQEQARADQQVALSKQNTAVGDYKASVKPFQTHRFLSPEYQAKLRLLTATGASGAEKTAESGLTDYASRTGENTGNVAATAQEMAREKERFLAAANTANEMSSQDKDTEDMKFATSALGQIPGVYTANYGTAAGLQSSGLDAQAKVDAARVSQPPWWQSVLQAGAQVGGAAIGAYCPVEGELVELYSGVLVAVDGLRKGDILLGIDGGEETLIEDPTAAEQDCVAVLSDTHLARVSESHAFVRAGGGYVRGNVALGQVIAPLTSPVVDVRSIGKQKVYMIKTDRTHTYKVSGMWSFE